MDWSWAADGHYLVLPRCCAMQYRGVASGALPVCTKYGHYELLPDFDKA